MTPYNEETKMQEADYGLTDAAFNQSSGNRFSGDEALLVRFYMAPRLDQTASTEQGRPIYKEVPYVEIMQPGNKENIINRPATNRDKQRFPEHFRKFQARQDQEEAAVGTPLIEWPALTRAQVEELKFFNIHTVEQLIAVSDAHSQKIMGVAALKQKAKNFLEASKVSATADALAEANAKIAKLTARLEALETDDEDEEEEVEED